MICNFQCFSGLQSAWCVSQHQGRVTFPQHGIKCPCKRRQVWKHDTKTKMLACSPVCTFVEHTRQCIVHIMSFLQNLPRVGFARTFFTGARQLAGPRLCNIQRILWQKLTGRSIALAYYLDMGFSIFPKDVLMGDMRWSSLWINLWQNLFLILLATTLHLIGIDPAFAQVLNASVWLLTLPKHTSPRNKVCSLTPSTVNLSRNCIFRCELRESGIRRLTVTFISTRFSQTIATGSGRFTGNLMVFSACWARHSSQCQEGLHASWHLMGLSVSSPRYRSQSAHGICCCDFLTNYASWWGDAEPLGDMVGFSLFQPDIETTESRWFKCRIPMGMLLIPMCFLRSKNFGGLDADCLFPYCIVSIDEAKSTGRIRQRFVDCPNKNSTTEWWIFFIVHESDRWHSKKTQQKAKMYCHGFDCSIGIFRPKRRAALKSEVQKRMSSFDAQALANLSDSVPDMSEQQLSCTMCDVSMYWDCMVRLIVLLEVKTTIPWMLLNQRAMSLADISLWTGQLSTNIVCQLPFFHVPPNYPNCFSFVNKQRCPDKRIKFDNCKRTEHERWKLGSEPWSSRNMAEG